MTENKKTQPALGPSIVDPGKVQTMVSTSLKNGSRLSYSLSDATLCVSLDQLGDWTIAVGLSSRSNRFQRVASILEGLGFFEAAEKDGTTYLLWTSLLSEGAAKMATEQTLSLALKAFGEPTFSSYIS